MQSRCVALMVPETPSKLFQLNVTGFAPDSVDPVLVPTVMHRAARSATLRFIFSTPARDASCLDFVSAAKTIVSACAAKRFVALTVNCSGFARLRREYLLRRTPLCSTIAGRRYTQRAHERLGEARLRWEAAQECDIGIAAAQAFFRKALATHLNRWPCKVTLTVCAFHLSIDELAAS